MPGESASVALAAVVFEGPSGAEGFVITDDIGAPVAFGRGAPCAIRFGHAPAPDLKLARYAGAFLAAGGRVVVETSSQVGHPPLQVCVAGRPPLELPPGEIHGPAAREFSLIVRGERDWILHVRTRSHPPSRSSPVSATDPVTERSPFVLSDHERQVLDAYVAPLRAGRLEPSTHAEVAEQLCYSVNKVRRDLYGIWQQMVAGGVAVPDYGDKRVAVAQAALTNRLT